MNYRKLRIAWSIWWTVVAVLLCVLWVRSYWHTDSLTRVGNDSILKRIGTDYGTLFFCWADFKVTPNNNPPDVTDGWEYQEFDGTPIPGIVPSWHFAWDSTDALVSLPAWFATAFSLVFAAAPWFRRRYSLRTLLITTTFVAVGLTVIVLMDDDAIRHGVGVFLLAIPILFWPVLLLGTVVLALTFGELKHLKLCILLIATTLVTVVLGLIVYAVRS